VKLWVNPAETVARRFTLYFLDTESSAVKDPVKSLARVCDLKAESEAEKLELNSLLALTVRERVELKLAVWSRRRFWVELLVRTSVKL